MAAYHISRRRKTALLSTSLALVLSFHPAIAEDTGPANAASDVAQVQSFSFNLAPQDLASALTQFGAVTGLRVIYTIDLPADYRTPQLTGSFTAEVALQRLLDGSGFTYQFANPTTITILAATGDVTTLQPLTVEDHYLAESAWGPVDGYLAAQTATGTKTDTPLIETPQSISVITADQMRDQGVINLGQALRYTPGVQGQLNGVDSRGYGLQMRGFDASDTGFYRDGMQVKGANFAHFLTLDPYGSERMEVLRGPASVLYGQTNPGGILNMVTKRPLEESKNEAVITAGNRDLFQGQFDLSGPIDDENTFLYRLTGLARDSDTQVDFVDHDRYFIAPAFTWQPNDDTTLTLLGNYQYDDTGWSMQFLPASGTVLDNDFGKIPTSRFVGEPDFDEYVLEQYSAGYMFEHAFNDTFTIRQNARYGHLDNEQKGVFGNGLQADGRTLDRYGDAGDSKLDNVSVDNQFEAMFDTGPIEHTTLLGTDFQYNKFRDIGTEYAVSTLDIFDPDYGTDVTEIGVYQDLETEQRQIGLYLQDQLKFDESWILVLGGRYDWAKTDQDDNLGNAGDATQRDEAFTGRVGLVYVSEIGLAPYVNYSESFTPILGADADGALFKPEEGRQYEIGIRYQPPGSNMMFTLAAYDLKKQNVLTPDPDDPANNSVQTGEIASRGIEFEATGSLDMGLSFVGAYTFIDAEISKSTVDEEKGERPGRVPEHMASLWADYTIPEGDFAGLGLGAGVRYIGSSYASAPNTLKIDGVVLADAAIHYRWKSLNFALNVSNIFDEEYVASCFSEASCFYGERRQILGSLRLTW
jgi:iron complex outermembrane receptor protein